MTKIFCDIGGTHIRFAHRDDNENLSLPVKQKTELYVSLTEAIRAYAAEQSIDTLTVTHFYFAFSHRNHWSTDENHIRAILPIATVRQVNDFEANAYGIALNHADDFEILKTGDGASVLDSNKIVMGVGTGLGLAYITSRGDILRTHGGHMLPALTSDEHRALFRFIQNKKTDNTIPIFEDVISGRGLYNTYLYLCEQSHFDPEFRSIESIMANGLDHPVVIQSLNIFHEMLGLFMHQAVAYSYAYGGVYLTGGMIDKLRLADKLDIDSILKTFHQKNVPVVVRDVKSTPIYWVRDEFISLKGLENLAAESKKKSQKKS